jgi:hypothetical protein
MSTLPPGMKAFKVIHPHDAAAAEKAAAKEAKRKKNSEALDSFLTRDHRKGPWQKPAYMLDDPRLIFPKGQKFYTSDIKVFDNEVVYAQNFPSSKGVKDKYQVRVRADGAMSCNCMGWSVKKEEHRKCPHCDELRNDLDIHMRLK